MAIHRRTLLGSLLAVLLLPAFIASAEETPDRGKSPDTTQPAEAVQAPTIPGDIPSPSPLSGAPELQRPIPVDPLDRGSSLTNAGSAGTITEPNILERAKLDMAREAIEASRLAGTLLHTWPGPLLPPLPAGIEAAKFEAMRDLTPLARPIQAGADGVGGGLEPIQRIGEPVPTEAELDKLRQSWPATPNENMPQPPARPEEPATEPQAENREVR